MKIKILLPMFCMLHMYVVQNMFFLQTQNSYCILKIKITIFRIVYVLRKAYVVYRCISLMNILNEKGNCKYSIEYEKSAYSYFLITFNLSFVTQIRSEEKTKERKSHDSEKEKEDDQIQDATTYLELKVKNHFNKAMIALNSKLSLFTYLFKFHFKRISQKEEMYICRYYKN